MTIARVTAIYREKFTGLDSLHILEMSIYKDLVGPDSYGIAGFAANRRTHYVVAITKSGCSTTKFTVTLRAVTANRQVAQFP